ncbi:hypothetical protein A9264_13920 [Vibrio sp. UCD-FRSSP16_10]|uniref:cadherin domain-containing protein n=1 Tax=unclassified Vibrio TaxID=2614977 RepID=UPI0007FE227B|nr:MULTISPECIES: cadherin domain-containing protein [unclassified Vibrio]OBT13510.1 hypothetical protein A9260_14300 [Vibrio sp. UCD-FRSSP16_30]OBT19969.1 hypothetical protein A9264_13920 [Vibrio sp. UCD-FRSSP16_10]
MDSISFAQDVASGDAWLIIDAQGNLKIAPPGYEPQPGDVILSVGDKPLTVPEDLVSEIRVSIAEQQSIQSVDVQSGVQSVLSSVAQSEQDDELDDEDEDGSSLTTTGAVERDGAQTIASTNFDTQALFSDQFTAQQNEAIEAIVLDLIPIIEASNTDEPNIDDPVDDEPVDEEPQNAIPTLEVTLVNDFIEDSGTTRGDVVAIFTTNDADGDSVTVGLSDEIHYQLNDKGEVILTEQAVDLINQGDELPPFFLTPNDGTQDGEPTKVDPSVTPVNDIPEFLSGDDDKNSAPNQDSYQFSAPEGSLAGSEIGVVSAFDGDGDDLTYSFEDGTTTNGLFDIDPETGVITVNQDIDDAELGDYELNVKVTDGNSGEDAAQVSIALTNINDLPEFLSGDDDEESAPNQDAYQFSAPEGSLAGSKVGVVSAFDEDGDDLTYSFEDGTTTNGLFDIDPETGAITVNQDIDDAELGDYELNVKVTDGNSGEDTAQVSIALTNVNDAPEFLSGDDTQDSAPNRDKYHFTTPEGIVAGSQVGIVSAFDGDGDDLIYSFDDGTTTNGLFDIDPETGSITVNQDIDDAYVGDYKLNVKVIDGNGGEDTAKVTVCLTNINDAPSAESAMLNGVEDSALVFNWSDFGVIDVDNATQDLSIVIKVLPESGVLQLYVGDKWLDVELGDEISWSAVDSEQFRFLPSDNQSGDDDFDNQGLGDQQTDYAQFDFSISDGDKKSSVETITIDIEAQADAPNLAVINHQKEASIDFQDTDLAGKNWSSNIDVSGLFGANTLGTWYANDDNRVEIGKESVYRKGASKTNLVMEIEGDRGDNSIYTDIQVEEGRYYSFTFDVAARRWANGDSDLDVIWVKLDAQGNPIMDEAQTLYEFRPDDNSWQRQVQISLPSEQEGSYRLLLQSTDSNSYGALIDNLILQSSDAYGEVDTFVELWGIDSSLNDTDGSEQLTIQLSGLPEGTVVKDDFGHSLIVGSNEIADVSQFDLSSLKANVPEVGNYIIEVTATATETSNGDAQSKSIELPLIILDGQAQQPDNEPDDDSYGAWGLTPKRGLTVAEGQISGSIAVKLLEGGNVTIKDNSTLIFTFALIGFSEGLSAEEFVLNMTTSDQYVSSSSVNSDGNIEVSVTNVSGADIVVGRGNSDDGLLSIEVEAHPDIEIEGDESFTLHLVAASIGSPKESQDEIDVTIVDTPAIVPFFIADQDNNEQLATLGEDILLATDGQDQFVWKSNSLDNGVDLITDFEIGQDLIVLTDILEPTDSDNLDELLAKIEVNLVGQDITLDIDHSGGTQTIVIQDSRDQLGDLIGDNGSFNAAEILDQLVVKNE